MHASLRTFLDLLTRENEIITIKAEVDPYLELAEIHRRVIDEAGPALLFERVKGSRYPVVTASLDRIDFKHPIPAGSIVEMVARVTRLGNTSVQVTVDVYVEYLRTSDRLHAVTGQFVMVAIGENKKPVVIDV